MRRKNAAIPRYVVLDSKTGEVAYDMSVFQKIPKHNMCRSIMGRTLRRLVMIAAYICVMIGVSCVLGWFYRNFIYGFGFVAKMLVGVLNVTVAWIVAIEWFSIDERVEAYNFSCQNAEYWEEMYIELAKKVAGGEENRRA